MLPALNPPANDADDLVDRLARDLIRAGHGTDNVFGVMGWLAEEGWWGAWMRGHGLDLVLARMSQIERERRAVQVSDEAARLVLARAADATRHQLAYAATLLILSGGALYAWGDVLHIAVGG